MKVLVIYESIFGNTKEIAEAIAEGMSGEFETKVAEVEEAPGALEGADLLVIGGPTHAWSMSRVRTREDARGQALAKGIRPVSTGQGIRDLVDDMPDSSGRTLAATFDTIIDKGRWFPTGSAAGSAAKRLRKKGYRLVAGAAQFKVKDTDGPVIDGEIERAREWGRHVAGEASKHVAQAGA